MTKTFKDFLAEETEDYMSSSNIAAMRKELRKTLGIINNDLFISVSGYTPSNGKNFDVVFFGISVPKQEMSDPDMFFEMAKIAVDKCVKKYFPYPTFDYEQINRRGYPQISIKYRVDRNS
jgi:hypothetical protein